MPEAVGKYIIYRLDSTVFTQFGRTTEIHKYQVKHQVDALITDNLGRPAYRIFRYIRDSAGTQPWMANGSYSVTLLENLVEVNDDNLRVIKLQLPFKDGFSWKGNRYLPPDPYGALFNFSNDDNMASWDFTYEGPASFTYSGNTYSTVFTVEQIDESVNVPITSPHLMPRLPGWWTGIPKELDWSSDSLRSGNISLILPVKQALASRCG